MIIDEIVRAVRIDAEAEAIEAVTATNNAAHIALENRHVGLVGKIMSGSIQGDFLLVD